jgi:hypothetical protein
MRHKLFLYAFLSAIFLITAGCGDGSPAGEPEAITTSTTNGASTPEWLSELIATMKAEPVRNPPGKVVRYEYQGQTVYYLAAECCDQLSTLYDADGNVICSPDGGIGGKGDGRCTDFLDARQGGDVVWEDPRT